MTCVFSKCMWSYSDLLKKNAGMFQLVRYLQGAIGKCCSNNSFKKDTFTLVDASFIMENVRSRKWWPCIFNLIPAGYKMQNYYWCHVCCQKIGSMNSWQLTSDIRTAMRKEHNCLPVNCFVQLLELFLSSIEDRMSLSLLFFFFVCCCCYLHFLFVFCFEVETSGMDCIFRLE